jgi:hypothetical protein
MHQSRNYKFLTLFIKITPWIYLNIKLVIYLKKAHQIPGLERGAVAATPEAAESGCCKDGWQGCC